MLLNPWVNAKTSAAGEFCCWKMLVYMLKMLRKWRTFDLKNVKFGAFLLKNGRKWIFWWKTLIKKQRHAQNFFQKYLFLSWKCSENYNFCSKNGQFWTFLVKKRKFWSFLVKNHNGGPLIFEKIFQKKKFPPKIWGKLR